MKDEIELGWLKLTDNSDLVLTTHRVVQQQDSGIFGESRTIIPREAITAVRLTWQRSRGALILGLLLLLSCLGLVLGHLIPAPDTVSRAAQFLNFSRSTVSVIQYALLISGLALLILFWFYKRYEIQIASAGASVGGNPKSYEDAETFCSVLVSEPREVPATIRETRREEAEQNAKDGSKAANPDWHL